jgi:RNA polymerase sigma factor for flagellar operon FliA
LPYIKYTAYRLSWKLPPHVTTEDLISVGLMGLMDALDRFEPGKVKLKTYAELRIKGSMIDELRATAWIPRSMRKKIEVINKARLKLEKKYGRMPEDVEVAKSLKMPLDEYFKILQYATSSNPVRLEDFRNTKYADSDLNITECIADPKAKSPLSILEEKDTKEKLVELIDTLPRKEKTVLALYYYEELTMQEIGKVLNITESRVCQIHSQALSKLKTKIKHIR